MIKDLKIGDRVWHQQGAHRLYGTIRQVSGSFVTVAFDADTKRPSHTMIIGVGHLHKEGEDERSV